MKEQRKIIVTRENIKKDIWKQDSNDIFSMLFCSFVLIILTISFSSLIKSSPSPDNPTFNISLMFDIVVLICAFAFLLTACYYLYRCLLYRKNFTVVTDELWNIVYKPHKYDIRILKTKYPYFRFNKHGEVLLHSVNWTWAGNYYSWSKECSLTHRQLISSTNKGDKFYLIMYGKHIIYFYNQKTFELSDDLKQQFLENTTPKGDATNE